MFFFYLFTTVFALNFSSKTLPNFGKTRISGHCLETKQSLDFRYVGGPYASCNAITLIRYVYTQIVWRIRGTDSADFYIVAMMSLKRRLLNI